MARFKSGSTRRLPRIIKRKLSENDIQNAILEYLTSNKIGSFERSSNHALWDERFGGYRRPNKYARKGVPDVLGCLNGRFIGVEIKTESEFKWALKFWNRLRDEMVIDDYVPTSKKEAHVLNQIRYIVDKNRNGAHCFFTYSVEHTIEKLKELYK